MAAKKGLLERLSSGQCVVVAEGYVFEFESRGYLQAGGFVPEVVLENPEVVKQVHREFVNAGSDVVLAFTYYAHRAKMVTVGRENDLEQLNRQALRLAKEVADETGALFASGLCSSTIYDPNDEDKLKQIKDMFEEQVQWAADAGVDYMVGETLNTYGEALMALEAIRKHGLPAVITLSSHDGGLFDEVPLAKACNNLMNAGASVVGLNCTRGPKNMLPLIKELSQTVKGPLAALPIAYRTSDEYPTYHTLPDPDNSDKSCFPFGLDAHLCSREQIARFAQEAWQLGVRYMGICCGNRPHFTRSMAEALGRTTVASKYSPAYGQTMISRQDEHPSYQKAAFMKRYSKTKN